jgi:hypothetical protein
VVGKDDDGEDVSIGVVDPDTTKRGVPNKVRMKGQSGMAFKFLIEAVNEVGKPPPPSMGLPRSVPRVVTMDEWKEQCRRRRLGGDEPEAMKKAFNRAVEKLQEAGMIAPLDELVWPLFDTPQP